MGTFRGLFSAVQDPCLTVHNQEKHAFISYRILLCS